MKADTKPSRLIEKRLCLWPGHLVLEIRIKHTLISDMPVREEGHQSDFGEDHKIAANVCRLRNITI